MRRIAFAIALLASMTLHAELPPLMPVAQLFGNPVRTNPRMSPDGRSLTWLAPDDKGVLNVWISAFDGSGAKLLTSEQRPVYSYRWSAAGTHLLFERDGDGDENTHLFSIELATGNIRDLTPFRGVRAQNLIVSAKRANEILIGLNLRDRKLFDMHRIDLTSGAITLEAANPGDVSSWTTDQDFVIRALTAFDTEGRTIVRVRDSATSPWRELMVMPFHRAPIFGQIAGGTVVAGFAPDGKSLYVVSTLQSDMARLERIELASGKMLEVVAEHPRSDVDEVDVSAIPAVIKNPRTAAIEAVRFNHIEPEWKIVDARFGSDLSRIERETGADVELVDRDADDGRWLVVAHYADRPDSYFTYDRATKKVALLFHTAPELLAYRHATPKGLIIPARDGMQLVSYLTIPPGSNGRNLPLVLFVHGGPWARDIIWWSSQVQFLANRGYAVLQVNYRGSTGLGTKFYNAGDHEFGDGMLEDLYDAVRWAIAQGIADPKRIAVHGASYGGYATLRALTMQPGMFACGVETVGISDLKTALASFPPYWLAAKNRWVRRVGDAEHDDALNRRISPLYHAAKITKPLMIGQGANDPRVTIENSNLMVKAMRDAGREVTYIVYPDEGHGFARPENNLDFARRMDVFLARCLGGRTEPFVKTEGSSAEVR